MNNAVRLGSILNIPFDVAVHGGPTHLLLTQYGQVMLQQVKDHAATYINTQTRAAQNNLLWQHQHRQQQPYKQQG